MEIAGVCIVCGTPLFRGRNDKYFHWPLPRDEQAWNAHMLLGRQSNLDGDIDWTALKPTTWQTTWK